MKEKFQKLDRLSKVFVIFTALIILLVVMIYVRELSMALTMDKASYNCTLDSMMMQICHDPFGASLMWTYVYIWYLGLPVFIVWLVMGLVVAFKRFARPNDNTKPRSKKQLSK